MSFTSGAVSITSASASSIVVAGAVATGGSGTYTYQWYRSTDGGSTWAAIGGATTATGVTDSSVTAGIQYYYLLQSTDTVPNPDLVITSSVVSALAVTPNLAAIPEESVGGIYNASAPTIPSGQSSELQVDANGNLKVNIITGTISPITQGAPTESAVSVGISSTAVLAANANRKYLELVNDSANTIYVSVTTTAALDTGTRLNANGGSIIFDTYIPTGTIKAIATGVSSNLLVTEG